MRQGIFSDTGGGRGGSTIAVGDRKLQCWNVATVEYLIAMPASRWNGQWFGGVIESFDQVTCWLSTLQTHSLASNVLALSC